MDAFWNGDCVSWTDFYAASTSNTFLNTDSRFSFCHNKTPFCFLFIIQEKSDLLGDEVTQHVDDRSPTKNEWLMSDARYTDI